jgi:hypothetical protein
MSTPNLHDLEVEERLARQRLARYRAKLYTKPALSSPAARRRLAHYERSWHSAVRRLRRHGH